MLLLLVAAVSELRGGEFSSRLTELDELIAAGDWDSALATSRRLQESLPADDRLTAWELDFRGEVVRAAWGDRHLYYQLSIPNSQKQAPGRQDALPSVNANNSSSDWRYVVVCIDLTSGQILWSRQVEGLIHLAVAPKTDALYLWREKVICLDARSGDLIRTQDLPHGGQIIQGLKLGRTAVIPQVHGANPRDLIRDKFALYDPSRNAIEEGDLSDLYLLSPNERHRLVAEENGWRCVDPAAQRTLWKSKELKLTNPPLWLDDSIVTYSGDALSHGTVISVDADTGRDQWSVPLGWGAYTIGRHQLRGGGYPDEDWRPMGRVGKYIMALDGSGRVLLLDPENGVVQVSAHLARNHLRAPKLVGEMVVVCSFDWVRAFPLANLLNPEACEEAAYQLREARCLHELDLQQEALATINSLLERAPDYREAWLLRAEVCRALELDDETSFSRCQALAIAGGDQDPALRDRWGLVRLVDLGGKPTWQLQQLNRRIYAGTQAGQVWSVSQDSLEAELVKTFEHGIETLELRSDLLAVSGGSRPVREETSLNDPDAHVNDDVPPEWWIEGGPRRIGPATAYGGRYFRPILRGGVLVLDGAQVTELPGKLEEAGVWNIHQSPYGNLGYGEGGVFELDQDLRPRRVLYSPLVAGAKPKSATVEFLRRDAKSIGIVISSDKGAALQIVSINGDLVSEAPLGRFISPWASADQLISVEEGYMFSDRQLTWVGVAPGRTWRFGPSLHHTSGPRSSDRWRYFGNPLLVDGHLYITSLDGHLLIFNAAEISRTAKTLKSMADRGA